jgi:hypothetical protein
LTEPRDLALRVEREHRLPEGNDELFSGWGVMGLPFETGHVLALRRFSASSVGPGSTALWHRSPEGAWRIISNVEPQVACPRYFGRELREARVDEIELSWTGRRSFRVTVAAARLEWEVHLASTWATRAMNVRPG